MDDPNPSNIQLQISFPKNSEGHRIELAKINDSIFAIVHLTLESQGPIQLHCQDWSLVLLTPIKSKSTIEITGKNIICLNKIESEEGHITIHATNRLIKFGSPITSPIKVEEIVGGKEHSFEDLGAIMYYYKLFQGVVNDIDIHSFNEAQQKFITGLCALAQKIEGTEENLTVHKVLNIWGIS